MKALGIIIMVISAILLIWVVIAHADYDVSVKADRCYHEIKIINDKVWTDPDLTCESSPDDWKDN